LHSFSYAARRMFEFARDRGWRAVMQQIDPGPAEERIVARLYENNPEFRGDWQPASAEYWQQWRRECSLADRIIVNSTWSRDALLQEGVAAEKMRIIPLAFECDTQMESFKRQYPVAFAANRPLRVLFLGQVDLRKGIVPLLEAAKHLRSEPVEFTIAGPMQISVPAEFKRQPGIRWIGTIPRGEAANFYREADVFLFPTFSDGFGLTQLEAQAWKLPLIASRFCGDVVCDGVNGVLLQELSGEAIAKVLLEFVHDPAKLAHLAARSGVYDRFRLKTLGHSLLALN